MGDFFFNISKGRFTEFYNRVDNNDPATSGFKVILLASSGLETDAVLKDKDTLADVVAGTTNEATNTGASRKTITDADLSAWAADDTNDRVDLLLPTQTWTGVANDGTGAIGKVLIVYCPDVGGADSTFIPVSAHDFAITPDGSDIIAQMPVAGVWRAQ